MVSITIRNVPDSVHERLTQHADELGMSLQAYMLRWLEDLAARTERQLLLERKHREAVDRSGRDVA